MKLVTPHLLARQAAQRWKEAYFRKDAPWMNTILGDSREIYEKLLALGPEPSPEDVNATIGNDSWTAVRCDECNSNVNAVVQLGAEPDYESATARICFNCLHEATRLEE